MTLSIDTFERIRNAAWDIAVEHVRATNPAATAKDVRKIAERVQDAIEEELSR